MAYTLLMQATNLDVYAEIISGEIRNIRFVDTGSGYFSLHIDDASDPNQVGITGWSQPGTTTIEDIRSPAILEASAIVSLHAADSG